MANNPMEPIKFKLVFLAGGFCRYMVSQFLTFPIALLISDRYGHMLGRGGSRSPYGQPIAHVNVNRYQCIQDA
jgi:hypothetical protein